jgi:glyoxylase-like metal-dependent hydrolase (beta-lactamase superfamily II)
VAEGWFATRPIADGLWLIAEPGHVSSWLVEGGERAVLFDTGLGVESIRATAEELTDRPISVVNTHYHFDHVGGNPEFDEVAIHADGAALLERRPNPAVLESYMRFAQRRLDALPGYRELDQEWYFLLTPEEEPRPFPEGFEPGVGRIEPGRATATLADGDRIDLGGRVLTVLHTPGHSPDSICLLEEREGWLIAADTLDPKGLYCQYPDCNLGQHLESVKRLEELRASVRLILVGHCGSAIGEISLIAETREGLEQIVAGEVELVRDEDEFGNTTRVAAFERLAFVLPDPEAPAAPLTVD